jgi:hypothetical protein
MFLKLLKLARLPDIAEIHQMKSASTMTCCSLELSSFMKIVSLVLPTRKQGEVIFGANMAPVHFVCWYLMSVYYNVTLDNGDAIFLCYFTIPFALSVDSTAAATVQKYCGNK